MPADLLFAFSLAAKMLVTAGFVVGATVAAERAGPLVGSLIATLPIAAGPGYFFLALEHDAAFIGQSALSSLVANVATSLFALAYAARAQTHSLAASVVPALALWFALAYAVRLAPWDTLTATAFTAIGIAACVVAGERFRHVRVPPVKARTADMLLRAIMVAVLVAIVVGLSTAVGPTVTGILAVFPIVLLSLMLILQPRIGGPATAAVLANSLLGMAGFSVCCLVAHLTVPRLGTAAGLLVALGAAVASNLALWTYRRRSALAPRS